MDGIETRGRSIQCVACGRVFYLTDQEERWFNAKRLTLPVRCRSCQRARRRERDMDPERVRAWNEAFEATMRAGEAEIERWHQLETR